jgi:hypothetical protein
MPADGGDFSIFRLINFSTLKKFHPASRKAAIPYVVQNTIL